MILNILILIFNLDQPRLKINFTIGRIQQLQLSLKDITLQLNDTAFDIINKFIDYNISVKIFWVLFDEILQSLIFKLDLLARLVADYISAFYYFWGVELIFKTIIVKALELIVIHLKSSLFKEKFKEVLIVNLVIA